ncbi:hypothetical protein BJ742DRAFT_210428 [Cladochytrium replicatum]|nr:hypothetical protein BJ742DRAFT_210428 [Cladochytrium replicatum]
MNNPQRSPNPAIEFDDPEDPWDGSITTMPSLLSDLSALPATTSSSFESSTPSAVHPHYSDEITESMISRVSIPSFDSFGQRQPAFANALPTPPPCNTELPRTTIIGARKLHDVYSSLSSQGYAGGTYSISTESSCNNAPGVQLLRRIREETVASNVRATRTRIVSTTRTSPSPSPPTILLHAAEYEDASAPTAPERIMWRSDLRNDESSKVNLRLRSRSPRNRIARVRSPSGERKPKPPLSVACVQTEQPDDPIAVRTEVDSMKRDLERLAQTVIDLGKQLARESESSANLTKTLERVIAERDEKAQELAIVEKMYKQLRAKSSGAASGRNASDKEDVMEKWTKQVSELQGQVV